MVLNRSSSVRTGVRFEIMAHTERVNAWRILAGCMMVTALSACAPVPADAGDTSADVPQQLVTAIPSRTATPDVGPALTQSAASLVMTADAARAAAGQATLSAEWTAVSVRATIGAVQIEETEVAATAQSIARTQTQEPIDVAASATVAMQKIVNATATAIALNADSEAMRRDSVEWGKRTNATWGVTQISVAVLILVAAVCLVYYIWRATENKAEGVAAIARAQAQGIRDKTAAEIELMRDRDRLSARLQARIREVSERAAERATNVKAVRAEDTMVVQAPSAEGIEPGTFNATTELVLRTLAKAASIAPLGWDDAVIPPQGPAWGGNGTRQTVVDILNERGLVRTRPGQGPDKGTRIREHGTIRGLYQAILDGQVVIYETHPAPLEVTAEAV